MSSQSQSTNKQRLHPGDLVVGEALAWNVYDSAGNLLLRRGFVILSEHQKSRLMARGLYVDAGQVDRPKESSSKGGTYRADKLTIFEWLELIQERLYSAFQAIWNEPDIKISSIVNQIAVDLQGICERYPDPLLAAMQLSEDGEYSLLHPLHAAVLCELMARRMQIKREERTRIVAGALVHDVGILDIQDRLQEQEGPLTAIQRKLVNRHPQKGAEMLVKLGIRDRMLLGTVLYHHERADGSGYPSGLKGDAIPIHARILSIADIYTAMIRPRAYRSALLAVKALNSIFAERSATIDPALVQIFISEIGIFPPGAFVRLNNGETAIITARGSDPHHPKLATVIGSDGAQLMKAMERDSRNKTFSIVQMVPHKKINHLEDCLANLWPQLPLPDSFLLEFDGTFDSLRRGVFNLV